MIKFQFKIIVDKKGFQKKIKATKSVLSKVISTLGIILSVLVLSTIIGLGIHLVSAWTNPTANPPGNNVAAPINVSSTTQTKSGDIRLEDLELNATGNEGDIRNVDEVVGYNDLFLKGNSAESAPVYVAGNQVSLYTSGIERLRVDSAGNTMSGKLQVNQSSNTEPAGLFMNGGGSGDGIQIKAGAGGSGYNIFNAMQYDGDSLFRVKGNGEVCIGDDCRTSWPSGGVDTRCDTDGTCGSVHGANLHMRSGNEFDSTAGGLYLNWGGDAVGNINMGKTVDFAGNNATGVNYLYASFIYDRDNPGYYVNPDVQSNMNVVQAGQFYGSLQFGTGNGALQSSGGQGISFYSNEMNVKAGGNLYLGWRDTNAVYVGAVLRPGNVEASGNVTVGGDLKADNNSHGSCYWTGYNTGGGVCYNGYYVTGVSRREIAVGWQLNVQCCRL